MGNSPTARSNGKVNWVTAWIDCQMCQGHVTAFLKCINEVSFRKDWTIKISSFHVGLRDYLPRCRKCEGEPEEVVQQPEAITTLGMKGGDINPREES